MPESSAHTHGARAAARLDDLAAGLLAKLPLGIVVADPSGRVDAWNGAAVRLLGEDPRLADGDGSVRCCDLFGCRSADGRGIVFQVRPAHPRDRRRRTDPHWASRPHLHLEVLSRAQVRSGEAQLGGRWLAQRPGQLLKFMVATRARPVHAEEIAHALWPEAGYEAPGNVRHHMHALRRRLEPKRPNRAPSKFNVTSGAGYQLDAARVTIDADVFADLAEAGLHAVADGAVGRGRELLEDAAELYGGDFLADEPYADWALEERDRLRDLASRVLRVLADLGRGTGDLETAYRHLRRLAELEPLDTDVQRELLAVCLRRGRRTEAARRYHALRVRTMRELGQEPAFSLADLADEIERNATS